MVWLQIAPCLSLCDMRSVLASPEYGGHEDVPRTSPRTGRPSGCTLKSILGLGKATLWAAPHQRLDAAGGRRRQARYWGMQDPSHSRLWLEDTQGPCPTFLRWHSSLGPFCPSSCPSSQSEHPSLWLSIQSQGRVNVLVGAFLNPFLSYISL